jgi:menaquinone-dependent protoporphyrinogen oxidase
MRVLVSAASKHGATSEVATAIAAALEVEGLEAVMMDPPAVTDLDRFDAVVVGSAVYLGRWLEPARELVTRLQAPLAERPVWLFSSGPVGDPPTPPDEPVDVAELAGLIGAQGHRLFAGLIDRDRLGLVERAIVRVVRAPEGDFRPWPEIEAWAREIATALRTSSMPTG